jgi:hypothetical protein
MRSIKEFNKIENVLKLKLGCYYKLKTDAPFTWVFQFKEYGDDCDGDKNIISGESYCVESGNHFYDVSSLCCVSDIEPNSITEISLSEFNGVILGS